MKELETRQSVERVLVLCRRLSPRSGVRRAGASTRTSASFPLRICDTASTKCTSTVNGRLSTRGPIVHYELFRLEQYLVGDATLRACWN